MYNCRNINAMTALSSLDSSVPSVSLGDTLLFFQLVDHLFC